MKYELQQCIGARLRRISRITDGYYRKCLVDFDITENQMTILFALSKMGKIDQGIVGKRLALERSTISRNIKLLHKKGLILKTDEYRPEVELTKEGMVLVKNLIPLWHKVMEELAEKIGSDGMDIIATLEKKFE